MEASCTPRELPAPRPSLPYRQRPASTSPAGAVAAAKASPRSPSFPQTQFGERVAVVGSFCGWDPAEPVQLEWSEGNVWTGEAELPVG